MLSVMVPAGLSSGHAFVVQMPDGSQSQVTVPPGVSGGMMVQVPVPAVPATVVPMQATAVPMGLPPTQGLYGIPMQAQAMPMQAQPMQAQGQFGIPLQAQGMPMQATAVPMQATAVPMQATAVPMQATAMPSQVEPRMAVTGGSDSATRIKRLRDQLCCSQVFTGVVLFLALIGSVQVAIGLTQFLSEVDDAKTTNNLWPDGGLTQHPTSSTIVAVYHRNVMYQHSAHHHHPHHPHNPHSHATGDGRRLGESPTTRHQHTPARRPQPQAQHQHRHHPQQSPQKAMDAQEPKIEPAVEARAATPAKSSSPPTAEATLPAAASGTPAADGTAAGRRRLTHPTQRECYDRWVFAFSTPLANAGTGTGMYGEPLSTMRDRLAANGWAEIDFDPSVATNTTSVVLSGPINRVRACDFTVVICNDTVPGNLCVNVPSSDRVENVFPFNYRPANPSWSLEASEPGYEPMTAIFNPAQVQYKSPEVPVQNLCTEALTVSRSVEAWYTNPVDARVLVGAGAYSMTLRNFTDVEWPFEPRAPTEWELAHMGVDMLYTSKQFNGGPALVPSARRCEMPHEPRSNGGTLSPGCSEREIPWPSGASSCPLRAGGRMPCWYLEQPDDELANIHGCSATVPQNSVTTLVRGKFGGGPPNPLCVTIFPPSWRLADWFVVQFQELEDSGSIALVVVGILFLLCGGGIGFGVFVSRAKILSQLKREKASAAHAAAHA